MTLQIPKLCQSNIRDVHDICGICYWDFWVRSFECGAHWQDESEKVLVQGEERKEFCRRREVLVIRQRLLVFLCVLLIRTNVLAVEVFDDIDVERNSSSISVAGPLRILKSSIAVTSTILQAYHLPRPLICIYIVMFVQVFHALLLQPTFSIGKLTNCTINVEFTSSQVPSALGQYCQWGSLIILETYNRVASS